jgi:hypothetical protein
MLATRLLGWVLRQNTHLLGSGHLRSGETRACQTMSVLVAKVQVFCRSRKHLCVGIDVLVQEVAEDHPVELLPLCFLQELEGLDDGSTGS